MYFLLVCTIGRSIFRFVYGIFLVRLSRSMFRTRSPLQERAPYLTSVTSATEGTISTSTLACICRTTPDLLGFCFCFPSFLIAVKLLFRDTSRTRAQVILRPCEVWLLRFLVFSGCIFNPTFSVLRLKSHNMLCNCSSDVAYESTSPASLKFVRQSDSESQIRMPAPFLCHLARSSFSATRDTLFLE